MQSTSCVLLCTLPSTTSVRFFVRHVPFLGKLKDTYLLMFYSVRNLLVGRGELGWKEKLSTVVVVMGSHWTELYVTSIPNAFSMRTARMCECLGVSCSLCMHHP